MLTGKRFRCWVLGLSCTVLPLAGCAQAPAHSSGGIFSWFRSRPLSERELEALERKQAASKLQDPAHLHLKYAQWRENVGDLAHARQSYNFALRENPKSLEAKLGLARLDQLAGRIEEAEEGFRKALDSRPGDSLALNALGQFYASQKEWSKALPLLEQAADAAPNELTYRYHLGVAMAQSGDIDGAFPHFQQAVGEAEAHYNIGYLLYEKGHPQMAKQRFLKAIALNPKLMQAQAMLDEMEPKPKKETMLAQAPAAPPSASANPIQQTAYTQTPAPRPIEHAMAARPLRPMPAHPVPQTAETPWPQTQALPSHPVPQTAAPPLPPVQAVEQPLAQEQPASWPVLKPPGDLPQAAAPVSQPNSPEPVEVAKAPSKPVHNPPAFRATRKQNWKQTETAHHAAPEFLPPYQPEANAQPNANAPALTPPITPAQREQWENQKASSLQ